MANFDGLLFSGIAEPEPKTVPAPLENDTSISNAINGPGDFAQSDLSNQAKIGQSKNHDAIVPTLAFFGDVALRHVYVDPQKIDEEFITEDKNHNIIVWNASDSTRTIDSIAKVDIDGTVLTHPATPITLFPETNKIHVLTVFKDGPPTQNAKYSYNIDADTFLVQVLGRRIEPFLYEPNWGDSYRFSYKFNTVLSFTKRFVEQRRALQPKPRRELESGFWFNETEMQRVHNDIKRFNERLVGVPIFQEELVATTAPLQGATIVSFSNNSEDYFNLVTTSKFLMFKELDNPDNNEVKEIASIDTGNDQITLTTAIVNSFPLAGTVVYPIFPGVIRDFKPTYKTDDLPVFKLMFEELRLA